MDLEDMDETSNDETIETQVEAEAAEAVAETAPPSSEEVLTAERDQLKDQLLRLSAEFDNYRKRMRREQDEIRKSAARNLIEDLLPVLDNLERALSHVPDPTVSPILQGVEMVAKSLGDLLGSHGLEPIAALGQPFDPNVHEALAHQPSDEHPADHVLAEYHRGYLLAGAVLRPAKVAVSSGPAAAEAAATTAPVDVEASASESGGDRGA